MYESVCALMSDPRTGMAVSGIIATGLIFIILIVLSTGDPSGIHGAFL